MPAVAGMTRLSPIIMTRPARSSSRSCALTVQRSNSSTPTSASGMTPIVRLVYLRAPDSLDLSTLHFSLTAQQSLKLAHDLLNRSHQPAREIPGAAGLEHYRLLLVSGGTPQRPEVVKEFGIHASDVPAAIRQTFHIAWPPEAIGLILIDHEGREVFGRDNAL